MMAAKAKKKEEEEELDETPEEEAEGAESAPKPSLLKRLLSLKMIIIAVAAIVVLAGGGGAGYFFFMRHPAEHKAEPVAEKPAVFVDVPDVLVNLANSGNDRTQYLKVKIVLELPDAKLVEQIQPLMPRVLDAFQTYLRELRPTDLDGSAGVYRLREALTRRVNAAVAPNHVTAVLFKEIIVQ
jgi:flagellar protein FliL